MPTFLITYDVQMCKRFQLLWEFCPRDTLLGLWPWTSLVDYHPPGPLLVLLYKKILWALMTACRSGVALERECEERLSTETAGPRSRE